MDDEAKRLRRQIRAVLVVFRAERLRIEQSRSGALPQDQVDGLRARSIEILDSVRAQLDGKAVWHPKLLKELAEARAEVSRR